MSVPTCNMKQLASQPSSRTIPHSQTVVKLQRCNQRRTFSGRNKSGHQPHRHASRSLLAAAEATGSTVELTVGEDSGPSTSGQDDAVPRSAVWELDFSSRPVLDERGKKKWELLICDPARTWTFSKYFSNNKINSTQLKLALDEILSREGAIKPNKVRYFRAQMQTIISRALNDLEIRAIPSRRCFALIAWLEERLEAVYKKDAGYSDKATSLFVLDLGPPQKLPDALRGERWSFVQLPLSTLRQELQQLEKGNVFGESIPEWVLSHSDFPPDTLIPGVAVYSVRAQPLAAWTFGYELANLEADVDRACLVLETGVNQRWRYASYVRSPENNEEAAAWQEAKKACRGLHFLAVQKDEEADQCNGLWLMMDRALPSI